MIWHRLFLLDDNARCKLEMETGIKKYKLL